MRPWRVYWGGEGMQGLVARGGLLLGLSLGKLFLSVLRAESSSCLSALLSCGTEIVRKKKNDCLTATSYSISTF